MRMINGVVDQYNAVIAKIVSEKNQKAGVEKWKLVDTCNMIEQLAFRKNRGKPTYQFPPELIEALKNNPKTKERFYSNGNPILDTRYLCIRQNPPDGETKYEGGIFSLDGVHPTTIGYGLVAWEFMKVMGIGNLATQQWWDYVVVNDTLVTDTPLVLQDMLSFLQAISRKCWLQNLWKALS
jgi:hypothetical protein